MKSRLACLYSEPVISVVANLVRGALIGVAEVIPGVSGGTIALIVGIYRTVIDALAWILVGAGALSAVVAFLTFAHLRDS